VLLSCLKIKLWSFEFGGGYQESGGALLRSFVVTCI
jgi:hypothetical protein